jgi:hypothetical protein
MGGTFSDRYDEEAAGDFSDPSLRITRILEEARQRVKPIVDREREGEDIGDVLNMRLD